jgi:hypothetical protein
MKIWKAFLFNLCVIFSATKNLPEYRYSRLDERWVNYQILKGNTFADRPKVIKKFNEHGLLFTLLATSINGFDIRYKGLPVTPLTLAQWQNENYEESIDLFITAELNGKVEFESAPGQPIDWVMINNALKSISSVYFVSYPKDNELFNFVGIIYEVDIINRVFRYYDDLGGVSTAEFSTVERLKVISYGLKYFS